MPKEFGITLNQQHIEPHITAGKRGGPDNAGVSGLKAINDKSTLSRLLQMTLGSQAHAWLREALAQLITGKWNLSEITELMPDQVREFNQPRLVITQELAKRVGKIEEVVGKFWKQNVPLVQIGLSELIKVLATDDNWSRSLIIPEAGVRPRSTYLKKISNWLAEDGEDQNPFAIKVVGQNKKIIQEKNVSLSRVMGETTTPLDMLNKVLIKEEDPIVLILDEELVALFVHNFCNAKLPTIQDFFLRTTSKKWMLEMKELVSGEQLEKLVVARSLVKAQAESKFLLSGRPSFTSLEEVWSVLKENWEAEGFTQDVNAQVAEQLRDNLSYDGVFKVPVGGNPDGFFIDPGADASTASKTTLEKLRYKIAPAYRREVRQPSLWQDPDFLHSLREGIEMHGWTISMFELKISDGPINEASADERYESELQKYCVILGATIAHMGRFYKHDFPGRIDQITRAFRGAYVFHMGRNAENGEVQMVIHKAFGNPLENSETMSQIAQMRAKMLQTARAESLRGSAAQAIREARERERSQSAR